MRIIITLIVAAVVALSSYADTFRYSFTAQPLAKALSRMADEHPDIEINFIYNELENYKTSANVNTSDPYEALRRVIGLNPVTIIQKGKTFYIEALQHGKYCYTGRAIGTDNEPVIAATVMLLTPKDSTVITYGITDEAGRFSIPCDRKGIIAKLTCIGYQPTYRKSESFSLGTIIMPEKALALKEVKVEADNAILYSDKSVYIPTKNQKNSAMSGTDLIAKMALPQLSIGEDMTTLSGQPVKLFIDYHPATESELSGMNISDVKKVEYYDHPADPRFQNEAHVINFIMQQYEYGGYVKAGFTENSNVSRNLYGYAKFQYKNMTYDWAGSGYNKNDRKTHQELMESYRLPQDDGSIKSFERNSTIEDSHEKAWREWTSLKALYRTDNLTISNMITFDHDHMPENRTRGQITYTSDVNSSNEYIDTRSRLSNSAIYKGFWYINLPHGNSLTFNPSYAFTHTKLYSSYTESQMDAYDNLARDNSNQASGDLSLTHSFGAAGTFKAMCSGYLLQNQTAYSGTSDIKDKARTTRLGPGVSYNFSNSKLYGMIGLGLHWDKSSYAEIKENSTAPWVDMSVQYAFNTKNSISASVNYKKSVPSSSYRSASIIQSNPFFKYTGNPALVPYNSTMINASYVFTPNNRYNFSVYGFGWIVDNRYAYVYEATDEGIFRTIKQPMGNYGQFQYGAKASIRQFDNNLQMSISAHIDHVHNGEPYNWTKKQFAISLTAYYYIKSLYFGASFHSSNGYADGCMVGDWVDVRPNYAFQAGWNYKGLRLRLYARNILYTGYATRFTMNSAYYDTRRYQYSPDYNNFVQLSATYTFNYGKKVQARDEAYQASGASSGILK